MKKQKGATLVFAMVGMVVLMLIAAALVRTVDTSTVIAGNLSFRMSATAAGDVGMERAITWLDDKITNNGQPIGSAASIALGMAATKDTIQTDGYYANTGFPTNAGAIDVFADSTWAAGKCKDLGDDGNGNTIRYVVERMCRTAGQLPSKADCIYTDLEGVGSHIVGLHPILPDQALIFRITARVDGPRNTVSYIQGFVY